MASILLGKKKFKIKLKNNHWVTFDESQFGVLINFLILLRLSTSYTINTNEKLDITFDFKNFFSINLKKISYEDQNLISLLAWGHLHGGSIINENDKTTLTNKKTLKILNIDGKKVIETYNGVKFFLDIYIAHVIECFVQYMHVMKDNEDWNGKVIVDVGANVGDTPLYYASMGAKVYAFELTKDNYDAMLLNIELNPQLSEKIIPINAGIGKDGIIEYFRDPIKRYGTEGGATMFKSRFIDDVKPIKEKVQGYSLFSIFKEFNIDHVDLLKMDCKGCEFSDHSLTEDVLQKVDSIKIEYMRLSDKHNLRKLLNILKKSGFIYRLYKHTPLEIKPVGDAGTIYAEKLKD